MDNFKSPKRKFSRTHSVDGFVPAGRRAPQQPHRSVDTTFRSSNEGALVGDFKRPTGFLSSSKPILSANEDTKAPLDDPHHKARKKSRAKAKVHRSPLKKAFRAVGMLLILVVFAVGGIAGYGYLKARQVFRGGANSAAALEKNVDPVKLKGEGDGRINVLLLGIGGEGHDGAYLTDTMIIASIDPVQNEAALLSIPRDLWVKQSGGSSGKLNSVYAYARESNFAKTNDKEAATKAGAEAAEKTISAIVGIPINYYVVVDFSGFQKAVDTVGGIEINVTEDLAVSETLWNPEKGRNFVLDVKPGVQSFDGEKALFFARSRHTSPRGDFDRSERQKAVVVALKEKVQSAGTYANPVKVTQLLSAFGDHVRTDLSINEVMRLYDIGKNITPDKFASIGLANPPNILITSQNIDGLSAQVPKAGIYDYTDIQSFVRNSLKDAFIKNENASIMILNGTPTEGYAGKKAAELKSYGYNVIGTGNAPNKSYTDTIIVDMRSGEKKYTKNYLEKRFGVTATTSLPDATIATGGADFVIILGSNTSPTAASQ